MIRGYQLSDVVAVLGSINIIAAELRLEIRRRSRIQSLRIVSE